ncbi:MAG: phosphoribosylglycinamide formyltransferase [Gemmatimonadota bacterium]
MSGSGGRPGRASAGADTLPVPVAVFASGGGSNLQALLDAERDPESVSGTAEAPWRIVLVVSDRPDAGALERARAAGRETRVILVSGRDPEEVSDETLDALAGAKVRAVFLAGYLRLLPVALVQSFRRRILNIHPSLLPAFGGKGMYGTRVHQAVLDSGGRVSGATVHFVDEEYDAGTILAQWPVPVLPGDEAATLAARMLRVEHLLYPAAARHVCRALAAGREPTPFAPTGDVFVAAAGIPDGELYRQINEAFGSQ